MTSLSSEVALISDYTHGGAYRYSPVLKFSIEVSEYLLGSGATSSVAVWVSGRTYETKAEADVRLSEILTERDSQWDSREAIIFLLSDTNHDFGTTTEALLERDDYFVLAKSSPFYDDDKYSLHSETNRLWLPTVSATTTTGDSQQFLLDVPPTTNTITLGNLRKQVSAVTAEVAAGDGSASYRSCLYRKYIHLTNQQNWPEERGEIYTLWETDYAVGSGSPVVLAMRQIESSYPDNGFRADRRVENRDAALFTYEHGPVTNLDDDNDGNFDRLTYDVMVKLARPLIDGEYGFDIEERTAFFDQCNFAMSNPWTVTVLAPSGTLHEFFFDPVTVGSAVGADSSNGVLKPTSFTGSGGASATVESISYDDGKVKVKVVPWDALQGVLDFIELDGTVSTSLRVANSAVNVGSNTFTWSAPSQPWEDGDKLMVRIRSGAPFAPAPTGLTSAAVDDDSVSLSWDSVSGVTGHVVERRVSDDSRWETVDARVTDKSHTVSGLSCGTSYEFRVGAYGDGTRYERVTGPYASHYAAVSQTTGACATQGSPAFTDAAYAFSIVEDAPVGSTVGIVPATDPEDDTVTYSITSGNDGEKFAIDGSAGQITLAGTLDHDTASSHTLTAQADDGNGGTAVPNPSAIGQLSMFVEEVLILPESGATRWIETTYKQF